MTFSEPLYFKVSAKDIEIFPNRVKVGTRFASFTKQFDEIRADSCGAGNEECFKQIGEIQMTQETITIENKTGIHARPASIFVQTATKFKSKVQIQAKGKTVDAKSILMIMSMGLVKGTEITIVADGPDEAEAVKALKDLVASKYGEE